MTPQPETVSDRQEASSFMMHGAREVIDAGAPLITSQVRNIENAVSNNDPGSVIDFSNSLIETTCITILNDRGLPVPDSKNRTTLFKETINCLCLISAGHPKNKDVEASLKKTVGTLVTLISAISELRNLEGVASHGKDAYKEQIDMVHAQLVARSADTVVNYLFNTHRMPFQYKSKRPHYGDLPDFNDYVDSNNDEVKIFDLTYTPSEVLFYTDNAAYFDKYNDFNDQDVSDKGNEEEKSD
jgi:hypothetical protein